MGSKTKSDLGRNKNMINEIKQAVEVRKSLKHGNGLFAKKDFKKGEVVYSLELGRVVNRSDIQSLSAEDKKHLDQIEEGKFEVIQFPGYYVNHSCDPNIEERVEEGRRSGYAIKDIRAEEEVAVDYDKSAYIQVPFECNCGSKNCRKVIQGKK